MRGGAGGSGSGFSRSYWTPRHYRNGDNKNVYDRQHTGHQKKWSDMKESSNSSEHEQYGMNRNSYTKHTSDHSAVFAPLIKEIKADDEGYQNVLLKIKNKSVNLCPTELAKVYYNIAEVVKRLKGDTEALVYYNKSLECDPRAETKIWSELTKFYTDRDDRVKALEVMKRSLAYINHSDPSFISNMIKMVKIASSISLKECYKIIKYVEDGDVTKYWKIFTVMARVEAENGNIGRARLIYQFLVSKLKSLGPAIYEWIRTEHCYSSLLQTFHVCCLGSVHAAPYGPIWFETLDAVIRMFPGINGLPMVMKCVDTALAKCSSEISWKLDLIGYESALIAGDFKSAKHYFDQAVAHVPEQLSWRVHYVDVHTEIAKTVNNYDWVSNRIGETNKFRIPEILLEKVKKMDSCSPSKFQSECVLLKSRVHEYFGWIDESLNLLEEAVKAYPDEWKLEFERIVVLRRANMIDKAIEMAANAVKTYPRAGRLWALYISLAQKLGYEKQKEIILEALKCSPKSGEVWCEMARFKSNPLNPMYSLRSANEAVKNAIRFTPQYGDTFIEGIKITILDYGFISSKLNRLIEQCVQIQPNYGFAWSYCKLPLHGAGFCDPLHGPQTPSNGVLFVATGFVIESIVKTISYYSMAQNRRDTINSLIKKEEECQSPSVDNLKTPKCVEKDYNTDNYQSDTCKQCTTNNTNADTISDIDSIDSVGIYTSISSKNSLNYCVSESKYEKFKENPLTDTPAGKYINSRFRGYAFNTAISRFDLAFPLCHIFDGDSWVIPEGERFRLIFPNFNMHMFGI